GGLGARTDRAASIRPVPVVLPVPEAPIPAPAPAEAPVDDDIEATVVVQRSRGPRRVLVLDDGRTFALSATSIVIGRNPEGEPGEQRLSIPDKTRTLSKTHARLVVQGDEWRLTDLHSTNGVVVVADDGAETLLDAGESVTGAGRFVLGEVGMHVAVESGS
ncbi:MAG TPA: FHA domain-containing protein, partial [Microbacterium sp.]|nr:FHA domain-containing protein [Microbacterium sp.]